MAEIIIAQRMWQRRDTAANWTAVNPVLAAGELGIELGATAEDTKFKIGNGTATWAALPYFTGNPDIEMRVDSGYLQYLNPLGAWENLIAVSDFSGREVELQKSATHIQWRYVGDTTWVNLVSLNDIRGANGTNGTNGTNGLSAYQVAVANGFAGTQAEWLASLEGPPGPEGPQGDPGVPSVRRIQTITDTSSGSVVCNWNLYDEIRVTMTTNTSFTFSGAMDGQGCVLKLRQDATGGRTVTLPASVRFNALIGLFSPTLTAGSADKIGFVYDGQDSYYDFVSIIPGIG